MSKIVFKKVNEVYSQILCDDSILYSLADEYALYVQGYRFMKLFKEGKWDGKIRYINRLTGLVYTGLLEKVYASSKVMGVDSVSLEGYTKKVEYTKEQIIERIRAFNLPHDLYDHQWEAVFECLLNKRRAILSSTSSGKSLIIYCILRILEEDGHKIILTVSTSILLKQIVTDLLEYSKLSKYNIRDKVHTLSSGVEKYTDKPITIALWQSINAMRPKKGDKYDTTLADYMQQFSVAMTDEVHEAQADCLKNIMENATNAYYRLGFTGTLDGKSQIETIIGLYGKVVQVKTARELIDEGKATPVKIVPIVFSYNREICKFAHKMDYQKEVDMIIGMKKRNIALAKIAINTKGNTIIVVRHIQKHAKPLKELLETLTDKKIILLDKDTPSELKEEVRQSLETIDNAIVIATYKLISTGVSIKNLHNVILGLGIKREIAILQTIGRLLRLHDSKSMAYLIDIVDNMAYDGRDNFLLAHFKERFEYYTKEGHEIEFKYYDIE